MRAAADLCRRSCRLYSTDQSSRVRIFDRNLKRKQRDRAVWLMRLEDSSLDAVAENLLDRLDDCKKDISYSIVYGGSLEAIRRLLRGHEDGNIPATFQVIYISAEIQVQRIYHSILQRYPKAIWWRDLAWRIHGN